MDMDNSVVVARGKGLGGGGRGYRGINGDGDLTWGGEHTIQSTVDVLWNCAPENYILFKINVTPTKSIKRKK